MAGIREPFLCPHDLHYNRCGAMWEQAAWPNQREFVNRKLQLNDAGRKFVATTTCPCTTPAKGKQAAVPAPHTFKSGDTFGIAGPCLLRFIDSLDRVKYDILHFKNRVSEKLVKVSAYYSLVSTVLFPFVYLQYILSNIPYPFSVFFYCSCGFFGALTSEIRGSRQPSGKRSLTTASKS
jgi:hypothetical protein